MGHTDYPCLHTHSNATNGQKKGAKNQSRTCSPEWHQHWCLRRGERPPKGSHRVMPRSRAKLLRLNSPEDGPKGGRRAETIPPHQTDTTEVPLATSARVCAHNVAARQGVCVLSPGTQRQSHWATFTAQCTSERSSIPKRVGGQAHRALRFQLSAQCIYPSTLTVMHQLAIPAAS